jgi:uncharacterized protein YndB with AHSA1/START domain
MRLLKALLLLILLLVAVFAGVGWLLPDRAEVERSVVIERPPAEVFSLLDGFGRFNEWSPWRDYDATAKYDYAGPPNGVGASMRWQGEKGTGSQEIIAIDAPHSIAVRLDFGADGKATAHYLLRPAGAGTRVVWRLESDAEGALVGRWFNLLLDRMVGPDYERGLADLKTLAESQPATTSIAPSTDAPQEPTDIEDTADPNAEGETEQEGAEPPAAEATVTPPSG